MGRRWRTAGRILGAMACAGVPAAAQTASAAPGAHAARERPVAVLSPDAALAVADGALWRASAGRWERVPMGGAVPRDVTAARGALWVLAEGTGAQAGGALVLRAREDGDLALAGVVPLPTGYAPRSLAVAGALDWILGGGGALLRVRGGVVAAAEVPGAPAASLRWMPDEVLAIRHTDGAVTTWRWGEAREVTRPGVAGLVAGLRTTLVLRDDGALEPGPAWAPLPPGARPWLPASGIHPVDAAVLRDGRVVEVATDGRGVLWTGGVWRTLEPLPGPPVTVVATEAGAAVVLQDGRVLVLGNGRWEPGVEALPR